MLSIHVRLNYGIDVLGYVVRYSTAHADYWDKGRIIAIFVYLW